MKSKKIMFASLSLVKILMFLKTMEFKMSYIFSQKPKEDAQLVLGVWGKASWKLYVKIWMQSSFWNYFQWKQCFLQKDENSILTPADLRFKIA